MSRLALLLASILVLASCGESPSSAKTPVETGADAPSAVQTGDKAPVRGEPAASSQTDERSEALSRALNRILTDLVTGVSSAADRDRLADRIGEVLESRKVADTASIQAASTSMIDTMILESSRYSASRNLTAMQEQAIAQISTKLADKLLRGLVYGGANAQHSGTFISLTLDISLPKGVEEAPWSLLGGFSWKDGMTLPEKVLALNGKKVGIAGYMMSAGEFQDIHDFLLVESQWSCCFGVPPEVHQVLGVHIPASATGIEMVNVPVLVIGRLEVGEIRDGGWVTSVYRIQDAEVDVLE